MRVLRKIALVLPFLFLAASITAPAQAKDKVKDGAKLYKKCAACHLKTGEGVPGSFPPINNRLLPLYRHEAGREYLALVMAKGLSGKIEVDGVKYRGMMPGQKGVLKEDGIAVVLNYVLENFHQDIGDTKKFTTEEVKEILAANKKVRARALGKKRAEIFAEVEGK